MWGNGEERCVPKTCSGLNHGNILSGNNKHMDKQVKENK